MGDVIDMLQGLGPRLTEDDDRALIYARPESGKLEDAAVMAQQLLNDTQPGWEFARLLMVSITPEGVPMYVFHRPPTPTPVIPNDTPDTPIKA